MRPRVSSFLALVVLALANIALCALALFAYQHITQLELRIVTVEAIMNDRPVTKITTTDGRVRTTYRAADETPEQYAERVRVLAHADTPTGHLCTTLTGCGEDGSITLEHCTPFGGGQPSDEIRTEHKADVDALCAALKCSDCGD